MVAGRWWRARRCRRTRPCGPRPPSQLRGGSGSTCGPATWEAAAHRWRGPRRSGRGRSSGVDLEEAGGALATADAHGDDAPLRLATDALLEDVAGAARAGHPE